MSSSSCSRMNADHLSSSLVFRAAVIVSLMLELNLLADIQ